MTVNDLNRPRGWVISSEEDKRKLIECLQGAYDFQTGSAVHQEMAIYDTFGWQVWFSGWVLYREGERLFLRKVSGGKPGKILADADIQGVMPGFYWEFPSSLVALLKPRIKLRVILEKARYFTTDTLYDIKNEDQKTVSRLVITEYSTQKQGRSFLRTATTSPVRGYQQEISAVNKLIGQQDMQPCDCYPLEAVFEACGNKPKSFSPKPIYHAGRPATTREAVLETVGESIEMARQCEDGIIRDLDTEFLHDYRVSIRSIRAILGRIKGALPLSVQRQLAREFSSLGGRTSRLRDLDVYLLKESKYKEAVPDHLSEALEDMFSDFRGQRKRELAKLKRFFNSKAYENQLVRIGKLINRADSEEPTEVGLMSIKEVACHRLRKQYRKVLSMGRELHQIHDDKAIHKLRLECKKLRYLLEYFSELFQKRLHGRMVGSMKELQDTLGIFNDMSVQQISLQEYYANSKSDNPLLGVAIGVLVGSMYREQKKMRRRVVKIFDAFDSPEIARNFRKMMQSCQEAG